MRAFRVLVVDDYPDVPASVCSLLEIDGHDCRGAVTGREALEVARAFEPDIALVDLELPDITGFEVGRLLREEAGDRSLFIAAISGWSTPEHRAQALAAGFDHHVEKPIDGAIARRIVRLAEARRPDPVTRLAAGSRCPAR